MKETREQKRNKFAGKVCRELRYQFATYGCVRDVDRVFKLLMKWFIYSKKDKYERPSVDTLQ